MSLLDGLANAPQQNVGMSAPEPGAFQRPGYFQWPKGQSEVVMCLMPPYKTWLQERIAAAQAQTDWRTPFYIGHGLHAIGSNKNNKVYCECRRTVLGKINRDGESFPLIPADIVNEGDACELCRIAWDEFWPNCEAWVSNKESDEYKIFKAAHRQATPQQKYVMNVLVWGATAVEVYDMPKTVQEGIARIQYDPNQPDLLFPYAAGNWQNAWIQITKVEDQNSTKYTVVPYYANTPFVQNQDRSFNEVGYMALIAGMKDLREELRTQLLPKEGEVEKSVTRLVQIVNFQFKTNVKVQAEVQQATAGVAPTAYPTGPAAPGVAPAVAPALPAPTAPVSQANEAHHQARYWATVNGATIAKSGAEIQAMIDGGENPATFQIMPENQAGGWRMADQFGFKVAVTAPPPAPAPAAAPTVTAPTTMPSAPPPPAAAPAIVAPQPPAPAAVPGATVPMTAAAPAVSTAPGGDFNAATEMLQGLLDPDAPPAPGQPPAPGAPPPPPPPVQ